MIYCIEVTPDKCTDGNPCYMARVRELPGCMSDGNTVAEALENISAALSLYVQALRKRGMEIPAGQPQAQWHTRFVDNGTLVNLPTMTTVEHGTMIVRSRYGEKGASRWLY